MVAFFYVKRFVPGGLVFLMLSILFYVIFRIFLWLCALSFNLLDIYFYFHLSELDSLRRLTLFLHRFIYGCTIKIGFNSLLSFPPFKIFGCEIMLNHFITKKKSIYLKFMVCPTCSSIRYFFSLKIIYFCLGLFHTLSWAVPFSRLLLSRQAFLSFLVSSTLEEHSTCPFNYSPPFGIFPTAYTYPS